MASKSLSTDQWLSRWNDEPYAYLTTRGRKTGEPHRIEIWFAGEGDLMYLMSGGRDRSDWVKNVLANPQVSVELGDETRQGMATVVSEDLPYDQRARELLVSKYEKGENLDEWGRNSLPVVVKFSEAIPVVR